jgi:hypothetical protein
MATLRSMTMLGAAAQQAGGKQKQAHRFLQQDVPSRARAEPILSVESIFTVSVGVNLRFPTHFTKNVKWMGHGGSLHHQ